MKHTAKYRFSVRKFLIFISMTVLSMTTGCGGGSTSSGVINTFRDECRVSNPDFPFCGADIVRCRTQDEMLYQVFEGTCPSGWTIVPDDIAFPGLACTNPEGDTFNVDADRCPAGWTQFTLNLPPFGHSIPSI